jgi:lysosomal alpha-glucosidase
MHDADFPVDVQWTDIDVMSSLLDFTYNNDSFHGLPELVHAFHSEGKHYVNIIDPGISSTRPAGSYAPYDEGLKRGIFIKKFNSTDPIIGQVKLLLLSVNVNRIASSLLEGLAWCNSIS